MTKEEYGHGKEEQALFIGALSVTERELTDYEHSNTKPN